jgi:hypothetical protein
MHVRIQNTLRLLGKQIQNLRALGSSRQSFSVRAEWTWAKPIRCYEDLPELYREPVRPLLTAEQAFPYTVLTPAYGTFRQQISEKLVCVLDNEIYVLERNGSAVTGICYPIDEIWYVEVSSMLLEYRIRIAGRTSEGVPASSIFRCSTATDYMFTPILRKIRLGCSEETAGVRDTAPFDPWSRLNFKFMNFARNSLLGGENVLCAVLQPEIKTARFRGLGRIYYRMISPTHTCILTDRELILIREEALPGRKDKYGGIWKYIPLSRVSSLSISRKNSELLALSVQMQENEVLECLFEDSKSSEVSQCLIHYNTLMSR